MEKVNIDGWWALVDLGGSVRAARGAFKTVSAARPYQGPLSTEVSVCAPTEGQPRSFPCAKRQLSIISMLKRQSLPTRRAGI
jgi:hypothetical protein